MKNEDTKNQPIPNDSAKTDHVQGEIIEHWEVEKFGAKVEADLIYYEPSRFCLVAKLTYQLKIQIFRGELCAELSPGGRVRFWGSSEIYFGRGPLRRAVATGKGEVLLDFDNDGTVTIESYHFEVCGADGRVLRCKEISSTTVAEPRILGLPLDSQDVNSEIDYYRREAERLQSLIARQAERESQPS